MNVYIKVVDDILGKMGLGGKYDPRHILGYIMLEHSTLANLSPEEFELEVEIGVQCVNADGRENAERCARSFGL